MAAETEADNRLQCAWEVASAQKTDKENKSARLTLCGCGCVNSGTQLAKKAVMDVRFGREGEL